ERLHEPTPRSPFRALGEHVGAHRNTFLICVPTSAADWQHFIGVVRDIRLREWPSAVLVLHTAEAAEGGAFSRLEPFLDCCLRWPDEAPLVTSLLQFERLNIAKRRGDKDHPRQPESLAGGAKPPRTEVLARQLQDATPSLAAQAQTLALAACHDVTVLLTGESGTGKTHLAQLIHQHSARQGQRFLVVPCGALAPS